MLAHKSGPMKKSRIIVLFLALVAAGAAFILASAPRAPEPVQTAAVPVPAPAPTDDVLVAARDLPLGTMVNEPELAWQAWPKSAVTGPMITRAASSNIIAELKGSIVRSPLLQGEPVRREKLVKGIGSGFMSAILPSGKRAVAINIDSQGSTTAGGFILPNDRVDVIRTFHDDSKGMGSGSSSSDGFLSETLLRDIRVLAIGQNIQEKNGQPVVVGSNATLELDPAQAETIILAQRTGQLSLVLRSMLDINQADKRVAPVASHRLTVVRAGNAAEEAMR